MSESHSHVNTRHSRRSVHQPINVDAKHFSSAAFVETNESNMTCLTAVGTTLVEDSAGPQASSIYANLIHNALNVYPHTINTMISSGTNYGDFESKPPSAETNAPYKHHTSQNFNREDEQYNIQDCNNIQTESIMKVNKSSEVSSSAISDYGREFVNGGQQWHETQNSHEAKILMIGNTSNTEDDQHRTPLHETHTFHSIDEGKRKSPFEFSGKLLVNIGEELNADGIDQKNERHFSSEASLSDCSEVRFDNNQAVTDMMRTQHEEGYFQEETWNQICESQRRSSLDSEYGSHVDMIDPNVGVNTNIEVCDGESCFSQSTACSITINNNIVENLSNIATVGRYLGSFYSSGPPSDGIDTSKHLVVHNSPRSANFVQKRKRRKLIPENDHKFSSNEPQHDIFNKDLSDLLNLPDIKPIQYECNNGYLVEHFGGKVNSSQINNSLSNGHKKGDVLIGFSSYQPQCHPPSESRIDFSGSTTEQPNVAERNQQYPDKQQSETLPNHKRASHIFEWNAQTTGKATALGENGSSVNISQEINATSGIRYNSSPGHSLSNHHNYLTPKIANRRNEAHDVSSDAKQTHHEQQLISHAPKYSRKDESPMNEETKSDWQSNNGLRTPPAFGKSRGSVLSDDSEQSAIERNQTFPKKVGLKGGFVSASVGKKKVHYAVKKSYSFSIEDSKLGVSQHILRSENGQTSCSRKKPSNGKVPCATAAVATGFWDYVLSESELITPCHVGLVSDVVIFAMAQMKLCGLTVDDRIGKYKNRELGFPGLCCVHCGGQPGFGRYFPGSFDSFLNGTNCDSMVQHVKNECRICPDDIRGTMMKLHRDESKKQNRPAHGSRRQFFELIWSKLASYKIPNDDDPTSGESKAIKTKTSPRTLALFPKNSNGREQNNIDTMDVSERSDELFTDEHWNLLIGDSELVAAKDRHLVEDTLLIAFSQLKRCHLEEADRVGRKTKTHEEGFMGMCCKHCTGQSGNKVHYGRYFPRTLRSLSQVDTCQKIVRHIATGCLFGPAYVKLAAQKAIEFEKSHKRKYGSRILFYRRLWRRLHKQDLIDVEAPTALHRQVSEQKQSLESQCMDTIAIWHRIIGSNTLVTASDRFLVSSSELAAIAQMVPCRLTAEERVGWFKDRPVGWGGLACKHCGGRPSYGKYFPKSSRTFAQTTCGQTILSHVTIFCKLVPDDIRLEIKNFQKIEASDKGMTSTGSRDHGSRKAFYSRIWKIIQTQGSMTPEATVFKGSKSKELVHAKSLAISHQKQYANTDNAHMIVDPRSLVGNVKSNWPKDQVLESNDRCFSVANPNVNKKLPITSTITAHADTHQSAQWIPSIQHLTGHNYGGTFGKATPHSNLGMGETSFQSTNNISNFNTAKQVAIGYDEKNRSPHLIMQHMHLPQQNLGMQYMRPYVTNVYQLPLNDTTTHNTAIGDDGKFCHFSNKGQVGRSQASFQMANSTNTTKTAKAKSRKKRVQKPDLVFDRQNQSENANFKSVVQTKNVGKSVDLYRNQPIVQSLPVTMPLPNSSSNYQSIHKETTMQQSKSKKRK